MAIAGRSAGGRPLRRRREMMLIYGRPRLRGTAALQVSHIDHLMCFCAAPNVTFRSLHPAVRGAASLTQGLVGAEQSFNLLVGKSF